MALFNSLRAASSVAAIAAGLMAVSVPAYADMESLLEKLRDKGILSEDEFNEMRQDVREARREAAMDKVNKANSANLSLATDVAYRAIGEWHVTCNIGQPVAEVVEYHARRDAVIWTRKNLGKAIKMIASGMSRAAVARSFNASGTGLRSALRYSERCIKGRKYREECDAQERAAQISNGD
jgi:hypothetical protein